MLNLISILTLTFVSAKKVLPKIWKESNHYFHDDDDDDDVESNLSACLLHPALLVIVVDLLHNNVHIASRC